MSVYPLAEQLPSNISHPPRPATWGVVIHETEGHAIGDIPTLRGPNVDVQFYVEKSGHVVQFLDSGSEAWHAFQTANQYCVGIEHEGTGDAWTPAQLHASARLVAWLCVKYRIPIRHTHPANGNVDSFRGIYGHLDLSLGHIDQNDHTDTIAHNITWAQYLTLVVSYLPAVGGPHPIKIYGFKDTGGAHTLPGRWRFKAFAAHAAKKLGSIGAHVRLVKWKGYWYLVLPAMVEPYSTAAARDADMAARAKATGRKMIPYTRLAA
jgi:N-acetylmuramoyl-L-alanine amidase